MKISQREAKRLQKRVAVLEDVIIGQRNRYLAQFPHGFHIGTITRERDNLAGRIEAARILGHAVIVTEQNTGTLEFYAMPHKDLPA